MDWVKIHRFQEKSGWCGPAVIQMALLSGGIEKTQADIAKDVYHEWWGTSNDTMLAYLSKYFSVLNYTIDTRWSDLVLHLKKGHTIIVNWWDDLDPADQEGHYSLIVDYNKGYDEVTLADPSSGRGIWKTKRKEFNSKWYDFLDFQEKIAVNRWMLWLEPASKVIGI